MGWAGQDAHMKEMRNSHKILVGKLKENRPLERLGKDGQILKGNLNWLSGCELNSSSSGKGLVVVFCAHNFRFHKTWGIS